jgi:hypothetical protein
LARIGEGKMKKTKDAASMKNSFGLMEGSEITPVSRAGAMQKRD